MLAAAAAAPVEHPYLVSIVLVRDLALHNSQLAVDSAMCRLLSRRNMCTHGTYSRVGNLIHERHTEEYYVCNECDDVVAVDTVLWERV